jgi:hypothetical protein
MAVTYLEEDFDGVTKVKFPVLHKVCYTDNGEAGLIYTIDQWCKENCNGRYYNSPGWTHSFIEFEDDEDAVLFALRWA